MGVKIIEQCKISAAPQAARVELSLPLTFFDMIWYEFPANQSLLFFEIPGCSKPHFLNLIVPHLKHSLSLSLSHFLPLAGNIIHPAADDHRQNKPFLCYQTGDSVTFTVSESMDSALNLGDLSSNSPRDSDQFYAFAPNLPKATTTHSLHYSSSSIACPVLALQVTLFPGQGICVGFATHHAVADASTVVSFMRAWALINNMLLLPRISDDDEIRSQLAVAKCLPFYDRKTVVNINGLDSMYWGLIVECSCSVEPPPAKLPTGKIRTTFVLSKEEIQKLKDLVISNTTTTITNNDGGHLSSFAVACALVWVCSAESSDKEADDDDEPEYFGFVADCRGRLNPPLPPNYFGNCVALVKAELKHGDLVKGDGFVKAVESIRKAIKNRVYGEKGILYGAEHWPEEYQRMVGKRSYGVAGSPRFDFYAVDYGWGRPKKFEALFLDHNGSISLCKSRDLEGALEVGISKLMPEMEAFTAVLAHKLASLGFF